MLKRLIIAVFGISLIIALGSIALASPKGNVSDGTDIIDAFSPDHPKYNQIVSYSPSQPSFRKPGSAIKELPPGTPAPGSPTLIYFGDLENRAASPANYWTVPDAYGDNLFNTRFTVGAGTERTLKVAHFLMYEPATTGTPSFRAYLWADDGFGFPGALLDSVTISYASIAAAFAATPATLTYLSANFSAAGWVFADGDHYHYGWTRVGSGTLAVASDNGSGPASGQELSSEYTSATWGTMLNDWDADVVFNISSEHSVSAILAFDCYSQYYFGTAGDSLGLNTVNLWQAPHPTNLDEAYAVRFSVGGPETLISVDFAVFDNATDSTPAYTDPSGDNDIYVTVYDDNGFGRPGAFLTAETVPAGSYSFYPALENVVLTTPLAVTGTFHIALSTNGVGVTGETFISDNPSSSSVRGSTKVGGVWYSMLTEWGANVEFAIRANLCRVPLPDCTIKNWTGPNGDPPYELNDTRAIPDGNPVWEWAQSFFGDGSDCRVQSISLPFFRLSADLPGRPNMYTMNTDIYVRADVGGYPGNILHTITLTPADYLAAGYTSPTFVGDFTITRNLSVTLPAKFWVGVRSDAADSVGLTNNQRRALGIRIGSNLFGGGGGNNDGMAAFYGGDQSWYHQDDFFGLASDVALYIDVEVCCSPFSDRVCVPAGEDWSTRSHDQARTGVSGLSIGDAWCDLTRDWFQDDLDPAATSQTMGPIIYENRVYQVLETALAGSIIRVFNLTDGAPLGTIGGTNLGNFVENDPLIVNDKLYIAGGENRIISRWDVSGVLVPAAPDWTRLVSGSTGQVRRTNLLLLSVFGTDVLFGGSQIGNAFAINESNGLDYIGWGTNPIALDAGQLVQGSATDGSKLYFGTRQAGLNGDVWAINPATGAVVWKLSTAGGYQGVGSGIYTSVSSEAFPQISYEAGVLYVGGRETGNAPTDGLFYRISAASGEVLSVSQSIGNLFANPIIDVDRVYLLGTTGWLPTTLGVDFAAYNKHNGQLAWLPEYTYETGTLARYFSNGVLTCEPDPEADILVSADEKGHIFFTNSNDGEQLFRRRFDTGPTSIAGGVAIGVDDVGDVHVVVGNFRGGLASLKKGDDRPRIEIQDYDPFIAVEFSDSTSVIYSVDDILTNSGCADLTISEVNVSDTSYGMTDPGTAPLNLLRPGLLDAASDLTDKLASNASLFKYFRPAIEFNADADALLLSTNEETNRNDRGYRAALAVPIYLNSVIEPYAGEVIAQGDSIPLILDVNSSNIKRGPQVFYIELVNDDDDYYLNAGSVGLPNAEPMLTITLVGGCLSDSTALHFGMLEANHQFVFNDGFLADPIGPYGFDIDNDPDAHWMSTYLYGVSRKRIALSIHYSGFSFISWQGDPNWCDSICKPALSVGVELGDMWDGVSAYVTIEGNLVCASGVDSVQHFGSPWDWEGPGPFNQDSTMGLYLRSRTVGAYDVPELANVTVEVLEFTERNNRAVPNWKFGFWGDFDTYVNSPGTDKDTAQVDLSHSAAWSTVRSGKGSAWGMIKLPYGCGLTSLKNARLLDSDNSMYSTALGPGGYLDSFYVYAGRPAGFAGMPGAANARDQSLHVTIDEHNFEPSEVYTFAVAQFGLHLLDTTLGVVPEIQDLANLTNKWIGFGRGDVNDDEIINLIDIMVLTDIVCGSVPGAIPFEHLGDVDADGDVDAADLDYLADFYFACGPCPQGAWQF